VKALSIMFGFMFTAVAAFGLDLRAGHYAGGGIWKSPTGETGKWTTRLTVTKAKDGITLKEKLTVFDKAGKKVHSEDGEVTSVTTKPGFFNTLDKDQKAIGSGYCLNGQCHVDYAKPDGSKGEETFTFYRNQIYRLGSDTKTNFSVIWQGSMHRVRRLPQH